MSKYEAEIKVAQGELDEWDLLNIEINPTMAQYLELKESMQKLKEHK